MSDQGDELVKVLQNLTNDLLWISGRKPRCSAQGQNRDSVLVLE